MIHIFNRKALITTLFDRELFGVQTALTDAKIPYLQNTARPGSLPSAVTAHPLFSNTMPSPR